MRRAENNGKETLVWEPAEAFDAFVRVRLMPVATQLGIPGEPQVEILAAHALFAAGYDRGRGTMRRGAAA